MRGLLLLTMSLAISLHALTVRAQEGVVLFESAELRRELCAALRIQLTDVASVSCRPEAGTAPLSERIAGAARTVEQEKLKLAVLLERDADPALVRMVLVGARADQAVLAIERIEDRPDPDVDRSLALKVRDVLDVLAVTREVVQARAPLPAVLSEPPSPETEHVRALFEAGGGLSVAEQSRTVGLLGAGVRSRSAQRFAELAAYAHLTSQIDEKVRDGRIEEREWGLALSGRAGRVLRRYSVGAALDLGLIRVTARGETLDRRRSGESQLTRFRAALGLDLRVRLLSGLALRFAPTVELYPVAQSFAIEERKNLELGRFRALLPLTLVVDLPLAGSGDAN